MTLQLGMVVLDVSDVDRSIAFYRLLGLDLRDRHPDRPVTVHRMDSGVSIVLIESFAATVDPGWTRPTGYQPALEFYVGDNEAVDAMWDRLTTAGYHGRSAPADSTGIYSALIDDPDGNVILISSDPNASPDAEIEGQACTTPAMRGAPGND